MLHREDRRIRSPLLSCDVLGFHRVHTPTVPHPFLRQVLFPVLMIAMVSRIICVRVLPDDVIVFETTTDQDNPEGGRGDQQQHPTFFSRVKAGWEESNSLFAWADKGQWTTTENADQSARREGDWFRIGFEPLYVDFTKHGSWFMIFSLVQVQARLCAA